MHLLAVCDWKFSKSYSETGPKGVRSRGAWGPSLWARRELGPAEGKPYPWASCPSGPCDCGGPEGRRCRHPHFLDQELEAQRG